MAKVKIQGNASGTGILTVTAPNTSTDRTITLPDATSTIATTTDVAAKAPIASPEFTGNVGVQVTPENWNGARPSLQIGSTGSISGKNDVTDNHMNVTANAFLNRTSLSTGWDYMYTNKATNYYQQDGKHVFRTAPSGSADSAITWTTGFEVLNDGKARAANGLLFGSDTAAANALDDYEEGTFTPTLFVDGSASGITYDHQNGYYTKIGRLVSVTVSMQITDKGSGSGNVTFRGLPFTVKDVLQNTSLDGGSVTFGYRAAFTGFTNIGMMAYGGTDYVGGYVEGSNDGNLDATFTDGNITDNASMRFSLHYFAD